jgi:flagellar operon protein
MVDPIRSNSTQPVKPVQSQNQSQQGVQKTDANGQSFSDVLANVENLRFSNHAQKRLQYRNISLDQDGISRLAGAVDKAEKRGGKESLVLVDNLAFIVNVKERLVVTALDEQSRGEGVFTQIDSVVFADPAEEQKSADNTVNTTS